MSFKPIRHAAGERNRKKAMHHAECLEEEIEHINNELRNIVDVHLRYAMGRVQRLLNRMRAEDTSY